MPNPFGSLNSRAVGAAFLAFFFAAFTLVAAAPHNHARSGSACHKTPGLSEPVAVAAPSCALCDWLTLPAFPASVFFLALILAACSFGYYAPRVLARCALPRPRRCPRGPPASFTHIAAAA